MYSNNDFERLFIRYKAEGLPRNESIQHFCDRQGVPYNLFDKWYRDTRHKVVPVRVYGKPDDVESTDDTSAKVNGNEAPAPVKATLLASAMLHSFRESIPDEFSDPYSDMDSIEKSKLIIELTRLRAEDQRRFDALLEKFDAMTQAQLNASVKVDKLQAQISELMALLDESRRENARLKNENLALKEQRKLSNKTIYGSKSQKSRKGKDSGHDDNMADR